MGGSVLFNRRMADRIEIALNEVSARPVEVLGAALRQHTSRSSVLKYRVLSKYDFDIVREMIRGFFGPMLEDKEQQVNLGTMSFKEMAAKKMELN